MTSREPKPHRWALSWPGNCCLDCGEDDPHERCLALHAPPVGTDGYPDTSKCEHPDHKAFDPVCPARTG